MKIDIQTILVAAIVAYVVSKNTSQGAISGFYPSNNNRGNNGQGPLKPYGVRWGNPKQSTQTTLKARMIV